MKNKEKYTQEQKLAHVRSWEASGLSKKEYCRRQDLNYSTFKNWTSRDKINEGKFIPVKLKTGGAALGQTALKVSFPNGVVVICHPGMGLEHIVGLIKLY